MDKALQERVKELEEQLAKEKATNQLFAEEITRLKNCVETSQTETEREEEYLVNQMIKRVNRLKKEKEELAIKVEQEEEYLTNTLQKKFQQLQKEKVDLELQLEQEEEFIVNKLHKQLDGILGEKRKVELHLEQEQRTHAERIREMEAKFKQMDAARGTMKAELTKLQDANLLLTQKVEREKQQRIEARRESVELMQAMEEISESGFNAAVNKLERSGSIELNDPLTPTSRSRSNSLQRSVSMEIPAVALSRSRSGSMHRSGSLDRSGMLSSGVFSMSPSSSFTQSGTFPLSQSGTMLSQSGSFAVMLSASGSFDHADRMTLQHSGSFDRSGGIPNLTGTRSERSESSQSSRDFSGSSSLSSGYMSPSGSFHNGSPAPSLVTYSCSMPIYPSSGGVYHPQRSASISGILSTSPQKPMQTPPRSPMLSQSPQPPRRPMPPTITIPASVTAVSSGSSSSSSPGTSPTDSANTELGRFRGRSISLPSPRLATPGPISPGARATRTSAKVLKDAYVRKKAGHMWVMHFCKLLDSNELHFMADSYAGSADERPLEIVDLDTVAGVGTASKLQRSATLAAGVAEPHAVMELRCGREAGESHFIGFDSQDTMMEWASMLSELVTPAK
eukprot:TRINITY_DN248_c0_g1_i1.p1 TRINITY_DN248_c0_g1~~TRINITY_DN248_c0_g1_i1.p1  ORF type:complete len:620 (-),score=185.54 TRINITY_DN248_c0_g1_i1:598-2457(-)